MDPGPLPDTPRPDPADGPPSPADVLRWCAAAAPAVWFPSAYARTAGVPRDSIDDPLWLLRQAGLIQVADWVRGLGQGYALTPAGEKALADPVKLTDIKPAATPAAEDVPPEDADLAHVPDPVAAPPPRRRNPGITAYDRGELTREAFLAPRPAVITPVLLVANIGWFLVGIVTAWRMGVPAEEYLRGHGGEVLHRIGAVRGLDLLAGEWWRLFTSGLVHVGGLHLAVNMFALAMIGPVAEGLWGRWRFAGLYLLAGLAGACCAMALQPMPGMAGASGSIWGIMMAVVAWLVRYREHLPAEIVSAWLRRLVLVIGANALASFIPGISWQGHLGGAVAGFFGAIFLDLTRPGANRRQFAIGLGGLAVLLAVMAGGLAVAMHTKDEWKVLRARWQFQELVRPAGAAAVAVPTVGGVWSVHQAVGVALIARGESAATAREEVKRLGDEAVRAQDRAAHLGAAWGAYLAAVRRYAELADELLAAKRLPTPEEFKSLADRFTQVGTTWQAATGQPIDPALFSFGRRP
ncbi:MAG TPA: rhomboid family intramembrane serine protease [Fimbriiglobus sp.]|nr:rhomboid family intramembrane serine protease [Fimbriiglobus sp.]